MESDLSGAQKSKWHRLKGEMLKRPLLALAIGLTNDEAQLYFSDVFPVQKRLNEIDELLLEIRRQRSERIATALDRIVRSGKAAEFGRKVGTNGMTIRYLLERKLKRPLGFDLIAKIEIYLNYTTNFTVSLENQPEAKFHVESSSNDLMMRTFAIADELKSLSPYFNEIPKFDIKLKRYFAQPSGQEWKINQLKYYINSSITKLTEVQDELNLLVNNFMATAENPR